MQESDRIEQAKKRVEEIKSFYVHLCVYLIVNAGLFTVNALTAWGHWWFYWPLFGWGIGVAIHGLGTFFSGPFGSRWEQRKLHEILQRDDDKVA
jgi:hypothetical protein